MFTYKRVPFLLEVFFFFAWRIVAFVLKIFTRVMNFFINQACFRRYIFYYGPRCNSIDCPRTILALG